MFNVTVQDVQAVTVATQINTALYTTVLSLLTMCGMQFASQTAAYAACTAFIGTCGAELAEVVSLSTVIGIGGVIVVSAALGYALYQFVHNYYPANIGQTETYNTGLTYSATYMMGTTTYISQLEGMGVLNGTSGSTLSPLGSLTIYIPLAVAGTSIGSILMGYHTATTNYAIGHGISTMVMNANGTSIHCTTDGGNVFDLFQGTDYTVTNGLMAFVLATTSIGAINTQTTLGFTVGTQQACLGNYKYTSVIANYETLAVTPKTAGWNCTNTYPDQTAQLGQNTTIDQTKVIDHTGESVTVQDPATLIKAVSTAITSTGVLTTDIANTKTGDALDFSKLQFAASLFTTKFPFSLPWDLQNMITTFGSGTTDAPVLPIGIGNISTNIDFSKFNSLAAAVRVLELFAFGVGLMFGTRKLLGGAS